MLLSFMAALAPVSFRCPQAATASIDENSNKALNFMMTLLRPLQQPSVRHVPHEKCGPSVAARRSAVHKVFRGGPAAMSIFGNIMNKIFHHSSASASPAQGSGEVETPNPAPGNAGAAAAEAPPQQQAAPAQNVDVGAVLSEMASMKGGGGNYQTSIVDLLKLLDLDSSLQARKELANELNVHVGADGSAEENIALHKAVMDKLAENGGMVPDSLRH
jgi:hypothetical protein